MKLSKITAGDHQGLLLSWSRAAREATLRSLAWLLYLGLSMAIIRGLWWIVNTIRHP